MTFFAVLLLSMLVVRIATVMLKLTGVSDDTARFQARSAFTGTGFTTSESENVVHHPVRRRIIMALMLVRNAGFVTLATSLMLSFIGSQSNTERLSRGLWLVGGLVAILFLTRIHLLDRTFSRIVEWGLRRWTGTRIADYENLLNLASDYEVIEMTVGSNNWMAGRTLADLALSDEGVLVLGIRKTDGRFEGTPRGSSQIGATDTVVLYGHEMQLQEIRTRNQGESGDRAHADAVARIEESTRRRRSDREGETPRRLMPRSLLRRIIGRKR